jgi:hypothetical protein
VRLHADGVEHGVRAAAAGLLAQGLDDGALVGRRDGDGAVALGHGDPLGHGVDAEDLLDAQVAGEPDGHLADRPEAQDGERRARADVREHHALPGRGQHVGQEQEALVRRAVRHLDRPELRLRDPQQLGLRPGHVAVQLGVAEQGGAGAVLAVLRRLALGVERLVAHPARAARDVERDDDPVAHRHLGHLAADGHDPAHRLVAEDVTGLHQRRQRPVEVQVRPADGGGRHLDHRIGRLLDGGVGDLLDPYVLHALPGQCAHRRPPRGLDGRFPRGRGLTPTVVTG